MKHLLALLTLIVLAVGSAKATTIDSWTYYLAHYNATSVIEGEGIVYAVMNGNLVSYDPETTEVRTYDILSTGMSAKNIRFIDYSDTRHCLVIIYTDGNIDILDVRHEEVTNIPHFMKNPDRDFSLNNLKVLGDDAFLCTNEGFVWIDLKTNTILGRYTIGATNSVVCFNGNVYAALKAGGVLTIPIGANYLDSAVWNRLFDYEVNDLGVLGDYLYILCPNIETNRNLDCCGVWGMSKEGETFLVTGWPPLHIYCNKDRAVMYSTTSIFELNTSHPREGVGFSVQHGCNGIFPASNGGCWTATSANGITHYSLDTRTKIFEPDGQPINGGGPTHETPYYLRFDGDRLFVAAGRLDMTDKDHRPFNASWYDADADEWHYFEVPFGGAAGAGPWLRKSADFRDASSIAQDPFDPTHHFVTSGSQGIFEYRDGKLVKQYTEQRHMENGVAVGSSVIKSCSNSLSYDYVRTNAAIYDKEGNLFIANSGGGATNKVDTIVWCLKRDGTWKGFYYPLIRDYSCFENSIFDAKGRLWITQRRTAGGYNGGFLCMDFNGTLDNTADDVYTYRSKFTNQDGTEFSFQQALSIAEDKTGRIWLGTEAGLVVVDDPDNWASPDFYVTQVKVPRPDGIYADYLLAGTTITAIAVDGADRKWIGTQGDGVYLVSADGITTIHHFTRANSPLVSDNITSIACHPHNGEVFIGTDLGLVSYHSDASESEESLSRDNLRVYPNPVRPDYSGPVILDGLVYDSDVKVVSTSGHVVAAGTSVGGTFTWDGRGPSGNRVGSGIYYFMVTSPDGKETTVAKVAVVR